MLYSRHHQVYLNKWQLTAPTKKLETDYSFLYWCLRTSQNVVLKIYKSDANEAPSAKLLRHYNGHGAVQVLAYDDDACVVTQVGEGHELVELSKNAKDAQATKILCAVVKNLHAAPKQDIGLKPVDDFITDFDNYLTDDSIPHRDLVTKARDIYAELSASQTQKVNLHGDLHHYNIMQAGNGEWLAIDPKGYWGEAEYECGAFLRNPLPDDYRGIDLAKRYEIIEDLLDLDISRVKKWAFCQYALAVIWWGGAEAFDKRAVKMAQEFDAAC